MASVPAPVVLQASAAKTATGQTGVFSSSVVNRDGTNQNVLNILAAVTAVSGTSPSMTLSVQWSNDAGTTWFDADPADAFTAITATGNKVKQVTVKAPAFRVLYTITGTTPSFTFSLTATGA